MAQRQTTHGQIVHTSGERYGLGVIDSNLRQAGARAAEGHPAAIDY